MQIHLCGQNIGFDKMRENMQKDLTKILTVFLTYTQHVVCIALYPLGSFALTVMHYVPLLLK